MEPTDIDSKPKPVYIRTEFHQQLKQLVVGVQLQMLCYMAIYRIYIHQTKGAFNVKWLFKWLAYRVALIQHFRSGII